MVGLKLLDLVPYELAVFRTLVSSTKIHSTTLAYHLEPYMEEMEKGELFKESMPLKDRVAHFLSYVEYKKVLDSYVERLR